MRGDFFGGYFVPLVVILVVVVVLFLLEARSSVRNLVSLWSPKVERDFMRDGWF